MTDIEKIRAVFDEVGAVYDEYTGDANGSVFEAAKKATVIYLAVTQGIMVFGLDGSYLCAYADDMGYFQNRRAK